MLWAKIHEQTKHVISLSEEKPQEEEGYQIAKIADFKLGDEFEYYITALDIEEDQNNGELMVTAHAAVKHAPVAVEILKRLADLEEKVKDLEARITNL